MVFETQGGSTSAELGNSVAREDRLEKPGWTMRTRYVRFHGVGMSNRSKNL